LDCIEKEEEQMSLFDFVRNIGRKIFDSDADASSGSFNRATNFVYGDAYTVSDNVAVMTRWGRGS